jgi:hypothetical protein
MFLQWLLQWKPGTKEFRIRIELFFIFSILSPFAICKGTSNFLKQVSQSKFTVLKIMLRKNFGEFMEIFLKGLNPFKIQTKFKFDFLPKYLIQILLGI